MDCNPPRRAPRATRGPECPASPHLARGDAEQHRAASQEPVCAVLSAALPPGAAASPRMLPGTCPKHQRARASQHRQAGGAGTVSRRLVGTWGIDGHAELVPGFPAQGFAGQHKLPDRLSRVVDLGRARLLLRTRPCRGELAALRQRQSGIRQERHSLGTAR
jgi:hypothetical protein